MYLSFQNWVIVGRCWGERQELCWPRYRVSVIVTSSLSDMVTAFLWVEIFNWCDRGAMSRTIYSGIFRPKKVRITYLVLTQDMHAQD